MQCVIVISDERESGAAGTFPLPGATGRSSVDYQVAEAARHGFDDILVVVPHGSGSRMPVADVPLLPAADCPVRVRRVTLPAGVGSAGGLRRIAHALQDRFLVLPGNQHATINLLDLVATGRSGPNVARVAEIQDDGRAPEACAFWLGKQMLQQPIRPADSIAGDLIPMLARRGQVEQRLYRGRARAREGSSAPCRRPAVFFDRDGTLNEDRGYVSRPADFAWTEGAPDAVRLLNDRGYLVFVVTNQSGVARGLHEEGDVKRLHGWMNGELRRRGAHIDAFRYCPHHPDAEQADYRTDCNCRKPGPGMIRDLLHSWPVDAERSLLVGDQPRDLEAARRAGIRGKRYRGGSLCELVDPLTRI